MFNLNRFQVACFVLLASIAVFTGCKPPQSQETGQTTSRTSGNQASSLINKVLSADDFEGAEFAANVLENDKLVVVDFTAPWCGPCRQLKPVLKELEEEGKIAVVMIDFDDNPTIVRNFGVGGIPHLFFVRDGKVVESQVGSKSKKQLESIIDGL